MQEQMNRYKAELIQNESLIYNTEQRNKELKVIIKTFEVAQQIVDKPKED